MGKAVSDDLAEAIKRGESGVLEFKPSLSQMNEIIETVSAFANSSGGRVVVGASNTGKLLGIEVGKDSVERLANRISQNTDPKIYPRISVEKIDGKRVIVIEVEKSANPPHLAFGRFFRRVGKSTLQASRNELEKLIAEKKKAYWDEQTCEDGDP